MRTWSRKWSPQICSKVMMRRKLSFWTNYLTSYLRTTLESISRPNLESKWIKFLCQSTSPWWCSSERFYKWATLKLASKLDIGIDRAGTAKSMIKSLIATKGPSFLTIGKSSQIFQCLMKRLRRSLRLRSSGGQTIFMSWGMRHSMERISSISKWTPSIISHSRWNHWIWGTWSSLAKTIKIKVDGSCADLAQDYQQSQWLMHYSVWYTHLLSKLLPVRTKSISIRLFAMAVSWSSTSLMCWLTTTLRQSKRSEICWMKLFATKTT